MTTQYAIAKKDISPLVKAGTKLIRKGQWAIMEGYDKKERIEVKVGDDIFYSPNFYPWEECLVMHEWWSVVK